jgi:translation initiation factor IF-3
LITRRIEIATDKKVSVNRMIDAREVLVIGPEGEQMGVLTKQEALTAAEEAGLDLVEVAPNAEIAKKKQKIIQVKEIKVRPKTDDHDLETKAKHARKFLGEGNKLKVTVRFRGREIVHPERGEIILQKLLGLIEDVGIIEARPKMEGRTMVMVVAPNDN